MADYRAIAGVLAGGDAPQVTPVQPQRKYPGVVQALDGKGEQPTDDTGLFQYLHKGILGATGINPQAGEEQRRSPGFGTMAYNSLRGLANMPGEIYHAADRLTQATTGYGITGAPRTANAPRDPELGDYSPGMDALTVAGAMPVGGLLSAGARGGESVGIFGGQLSKTADLAALEKAKAAKAAGVPREQIWGEHGWFEGVDGKWRYEIDDSKSSINKPFRSETDDYGVTPPRSMTGMLPDILNHDALFAAYPSLRDVETEANIRNGNVHKTGEYDDRRQSSNTPKITLNYSGDMGGRSVLMHEAQHAVQDIEGFHPGGSPHEWGGNAAYDAYRAIPGEVEARAVEKRLAESWNRADGLQEYNADLAAGNDKQPWFARKWEDDPHFASGQKHPAPWLDYDVPENQQIVRHGGNAPQMSAGAERVNLFPFSNPATAAPLAGVGQDDDSKRAALIAALHAAGQ